MHIQKVLNLSSNNTLKIFSIVILLTGLLTSQLEAVAQCCAPGNPVSGNEYNGILPKRTLRTVTFYRHSKSDTYFENSEKSDLQGTTAGYDYIGEVISYGLVKRLSAEAEVGYYLDKHQDSEVLGRFTTYGFNNAVLSLKYAVIKTKNDLEVTLGSGIKIPLSTKVFYDEYGLPYGQDIHPSTRAYGVTGQLYVYKGFMKKWRAVVHARYDHNGYNSENYKFGDAFITSIFISRSFKHNWGATLQLRNEFRSEDFQGEVHYLSTGGNIKYFSPQISKTFKHRITAAATADLPFFRRYNGIQLSPKYAFGLSLVKDFCFQ